MNRGSEDGFVLVTVIWFIALIALAATIMSGWVSDSLQRATALKDRINAERDMINATDQVAYLITSSYFTTAGLITTNGANANITVSPMGYMPTKNSHPLLIDGRPYRFGSGIIELQDGRGLYNLVTIDDYTFRHLVGYFGLSPQESSGLLDKLHDYQNKNGAVQRLNGANRDAYVRAGRPPPRNAQLITPWETYRVMGWDTYPALWIGPNTFADLTDVTPDNSGFNPNTAPAALLSTLPGVDQNAVDKILRVRQVGPIASLGELERLTGTVIPLDPFSVTALPGSTLRAEMAFPESPLTRVVFYSLPPVGRTPYRIEYVVDVPQKPQLRAALARSDLEQFPAFGPAP
jgi:hypothetical protein